MRIPEYPQLPSAVEHDRRRLDARIVVRLPAPCAEDTLVEALPVGLDHRVLLELTVRVRRRLLLFRGEAFPLEADEFELNSSD